MANEVTTTTLATGIPNPAYWPDFDLGANEEMVFANKIKTYGMVNGSLKIPFIAPIAAATLSAGSGGALTYTANTESSATLTAASRYAAVKVERQAAVRAIKDPASAYKSQLQKALATIIDADCLQDVASLATNIVNAASGITKSEALDAYQKGAAGAKEFWVPGETGVTGVVHVSQVDEINSIGDWISAQVRGDSANPVVRGWVRQAGGINWLESGNVYTSGGVAYNCIFIPQAFGIGYNQRPQPLEQPFELLTKLIVWADYAHNIVRDAYAVQITSPAV